MNTGLETWASDQYVLSQFKGGCGKTSLGEDWLARSKKMKEQSTPNDGEPLSESTTDAAKNDQLPDDTAPIVKLGEDEASSDPDEVSEPEHTAVEMKSQRSGGYGIGGILFGGISAAAIGFLAAQYSGNDRWPFSSDNSVTDDLVQKIAGLENTVEEQQVELRNLTIDLASKSNLVELGQLNKKVQESNAVSVSISNDLAGLTDRLTDIENRPIPETGANQEAVDYYVQELAAMRVMLNDELARIEERQEIVATESLEVAELARSSTIHQAISQVQVAAQYGLPFFDQLDELKSAGIQIAPGLEELAKIGIPTLEALSNEFPTGARQTLAASAAAVSPKSDNSTGVVAFLRAQLGIRSLEPKSGESVDAVLSRAEAAVNSDDIAVALSELETLPESAGDEMRLWIERARQRQDALKFISALATQVSE